MSPAHSGTSRRWPAILLVVVVLAGGALVARAGRSGPAPGLPTAPVAFVSPAGTESAAWYCAGKTTATGALATGSVDLTNTGTRAVQGTVTATTDTGATVTAPVSVPAHGQLVSPSPALTGSWVSESVVLSGGGVAVTQLLAGASGWTESPCQSGTSQSWYFPVGDTSGSSTMYMALYNPTSTPDVVDLTFVTASGVFHPISFQGIVLAPGRTAVENVGQYVQDQAEVATTVTTRTGRVVASETQVFAGGAAGLANVPGSPRPETQWSIPQAEEVTGGATSIDVYNPGPTTEEVTVRARLASGPLPLFRTEVAPQSDWQLVTSNQTRIPKYSQGSGGYSTAITASGGPGVVVGRAVADPAAGAAPQAGMSMAVDGLSTAWPSHQWVVPSPGTASMPATSGAEPAAVAVFNPTGTDENYAIEVMTPGGTRTVTRGRLPPLTSISLSGKPLSAAGLNPLLVDATGPVSVCEDVGPSGMYGAVSMPGIPISTGG